MLTLAATPVVRCGPAREECGPLPHHEREAPSAITDFSPCLPLEAGQGCADFVCNGTKSLNAVLFCRACEAGLGPQEDCGEDAGCDPCPRCLEPYCLNTTTTDADREQVLSFINGLRNE
eukprot:gene5869-5777_t